MNNNYNIIEIKNFSKSFGKFKSIDDISFNVKNNSIHAFIGPNGAGKTTTIKTLIGAYIPTKGDVKIKNYKAGTPKANKFIGYIPEKAIFPSFLKAGEYLSEMAKLSKINKKEIPQKVETLLRKFNLYDFRNKDPRKFSSGMQKKLLLAQALISEPVILILDEPAANLDPIARYELFKELEILREQGKTIFITSHVLVELEKISDYVTFISKGKILFSGSVDDLESKVENILVIKTSDNFKFNELLKISNENSVINGGEINIKDFSKNQEELFLLARKNNIKINELRTRELQKAYNFLLENENNLSNNDQRNEPK